MEFSDKDIEQLKTLRDFLKNTFGQSSFGKLKMDDVIESLEAAILKLEGKNEGIE